MDGDMISYGQNLKDNVNTMIEVAKERELNNWKENQVYEEVEERKNMNIVSTKWNIQEK